MTAPVLPPVLPPAAETSPAAGEHPTTIADLIDRAADLIGEYGAHRHDWWLHASEHAWDDQPLDLVAAVAVAVGYRTASQVERDFCGLDASGVSTCPHPVMARLMAQMRCSAVEQLFDWSDSARQDQAVARLREAATAEREGRLS